MKILHLISSLKMGGAETALFNFLCYAVQYQYDEHVVAYIHKGPYVEQIAHLGIPVYSVAGLISSADPMSYIRLSRLITTYKPDVIHSSLWAANLLGRLVAYRYNIPLVSEIHGDCRVVSAAWKNYLDARTVHLPDQQKIVAVSHGVSKAYVARVVGAVADHHRRARVSSQVMVIPNAIAIDLLRARAMENPLTRAELGYTEDDFIIGAVGRLASVKSYDHLLRAFSIVRRPKMKLCLVGDGPERPFLEALAEGLHIQDAVYFAGERTDAYRFYQLFDCFALSSQTEGLSLALLEALAFGLPIITTNPTPIHEVITDQIHGFVVPLNDLAAYAQAILTLSHDRSLCLKMGQANLLLVKSYSLDHYATAYTDLLRVMASASKPTR